MIGNWIDDIGSAQWACICLFLVLALVGTVVALAQFMYGFSKELKYLNCEIGRTSGDERAHWKRLRRRLWLSLIPFVKK